MKSMLLKVTGLAALAAAMMFAQNTPSAGGQTRSHSHAARQGHFARMAEVLNLTADQRAQVKSIMSSEKQTIAPLREQLKQSREALRAAIKSGNDAQIDQITQAEAPLLAQVAAARAHAFEKIYATLTPDQKAKADQMQQMFKAHRG